MSVLKWVVVQWSEHTQSWRTPFSSSNSYPDKTFKDTEDAAWEEIRRLKRESYNKDVEFATVGALMPDPPVIANPTTAQTWMATITSGDHRFSDAPAIGNFSSTDPDGITRFGMIVSKETTTSPIILRNMGYHQNANGDWIKYHGTTNGTNDNKTV
jgi:hypothetical protein